MEDILRRMAVAADQWETVQEKDGIGVFRVFSGKRRYVLKVFDREEDRREIRHYAILRSLGLFTIPLAAQTGEALLMEDLEAGGPWRLGTEEDMRDPDAAVLIARWYRQLHDRGRAFVASCAEPLYDETDCLTRETLAWVRERTGSGEAPVWGLLDRGLDRFRRRIGGLEKTLVYNDFYYTNLAVARDASAAFLFDYNLLGRGYAYGDIRNVCSSLSFEAGEAFRREYGECDPAEEAVDAVAAPLVTLYHACRRERFPVWAADELEKVRDGRLEAAVRALGIAE